MDLSELERLKEENRRLTELNITKSGEVSILRANMSSMENREADLSAPSPVPNASMQLNKPFPLYLQSPVLPEPRVRLHPSQLLQLNKQN